MLITGTGWTIDVVDALWFGDAMALVTYWAEFPPTHVTLAAMVKGLSGATETPRPPTPDELQALVGQLNRP